MKLYALESSECSDYGMPGWSGWGGGVFCSEQFSLLEKSVFFFEILS